MNLNGKATNPGELRTKITLKKRTLTTDPGGFQVPSPGDTIAEVWAKWINVHGSEVWAAQTIQAEEAATVTIRYLAGLDATCYAIKGDQVYEIISPDDIQERHEYIEFKVRRLGSG